MKSVIIYGRVDTHHDCYGAIETCHYIDSQGKFILTIRTEIVEGSEVEALDKARPRHRRGTTPEVVLNTILLEE